MFGFSQMRHGVSTACLYDFSHVSCPHLLFMLQIAEWPQPELGDIIASTLDSGLEVSLWKQSSRANSIEIHPRGLLVSFLDLSQIGTYVS